MLRTRETLVINEDMAQHLRTFGSFVMPGTAMEKSAVFVPLVVGRPGARADHLIDMNREHAFGDSDVRLLQTLASA